MNQETTIKTVDFLGFRLYPGSLEKTLEDIDRVIAQRLPEQHCVLNSYKWLLIKRDPEVAAIIRECRFVQADGMSIVWAANLLGLPPIPRVTGVDLMEALIRRSADKGYRVYFLGAQQSVLDRTIEHFVGLYPSLNVAGSHHGYYQDEAALADEVRASHADVLIVAISSPQKEKLIHRNLAVMNVPFCMGVGGGFDVIAGVATRAPGWIQRSGFEWLYRLVQEPGRLWKRYTVSHLNLVASIGMQLVKSPLWWRRLAFLAGGAVYLAASLFITARQGVIGAVVSGVSLLVGLLALQQPHNAFKILLAMMPLVGLIAALIPGAGPKVAYFVAPSSAVIWGLINDRNRMHALFLSRFPGALVWIVYLGLVLAAGMKALMGGGDPMAVASQALLWCNGLFVLGYVRILFPA